MCDQTTTKIVYALQERANEDMIIQQHEATIAAALALPEAERYRMWLELSKEFPQSEIIINEVYSPDTVLVADSAHLDEILKWAAQKDREYRRFADEQEAAQQ